MSCRILQLEIDKLKQSKDTQYAKHNAEKSCCSETDSEGNFNISEEKPDTCGSTESMARVEVSDDSPPTPFLNSSRSSSRLRPKYGGQDKNAFASSPKNLSKSASSNRTVGYKRARIVLSDSEDEICAETGGLKGTTQSNPVEDVGTSYECRCS